jgi:putative membrane protein
MIPIATLRHRNIGRGLRFAFIASLGLAAVAATAAPRWRGPAARSFVRSFAAEPLATDTLRPTERSFLEKAADLSRDEVQIARLAVAQATSTDIRAFAQQIAADHKQLNDSVEALRRRKGSAAPGTGEKENGKGPEITTEASQKLAQKTGADFDKEFIRVIGQLHTSAVTLFEEAMADAKDGDVRDLAGSYLPTLRDHQNRITELRKTLE